MFTFTNIPITIKAHLNLGVNGMNAILQPLLIINNNKKKIMVIEYNHNKAIFSVKSVQIIYKLNAKTYS